jgi:hypothetical protein
LQTLGGLLAHRHHHRQRHAAFARRTEGRAGQIGDDLIEIGIGHHDPVVLRPAHACTRLLFAQAARIDILRRCRTSRRS